MKVELIQNGIGNYSEKSPPSKFWLVLRLIKTSAVRVDEVLLS
jgi:hypothetical protein